MEQTELPYLRKQLRSFAFDKELDQAIFFMRRFLPPSQVFPVIQLFRNVYHRLGWCELLKITPDMFYI